MSLYEIFLIVVRWIHASATIAWVGGSLFYLLVLRPATKDTYPAAWRQISGPVGRAFSEVAQVSILVLIITGVILMLDRLAGNIASNTYMAFLGVKIILSIWAFFIVLTLRSSRRRIVDSGNTQALISQGVNTDGLFNHLKLSARVAMMQLKGPNLLAVLGLIIVLLSDALKVIAEQVLH
jgi:uncharacterized membrane protein